MPELYSFFSDATVSNIWRASEASDTLSGMYQFEICDICMYTVYGCM